MILEQRQTKRLYKLYDLLMYFAAREFDTYSKIVTPTGKVDEDELFNTAQQLWGEGGDRTLIDRYVAQNPDRLSRSDLREIESWKDALYGQFGVARIGRDVLFLYGDHAFAVRGLTNEIDTILGDLPTFTTTILLPFDGLITFATSALTYSVDMGPNITQSIMQDAEQCQKEGKLARTARDFYRMAPLAIEEQKIQKAENDAFDSEMKANADELGADQHKGVLAGLSWEERSKAVAKWYEGEPRTTPAYIYTQLDAWCEKGKPARTFEDVYLKLDKEELVRFAALQGVKGKLTKMSKKQLASQIASHYKPVVREVLDLFGCEGPAQMQNARRIYEAHGSLVVTEGEITCLNDVARPCFPYLSIYHRGQDYEFVMPEVVVELLADVDWEAEIHDAESIEDAIRFIDRMVDFYGVVPALDAAEEIDRRFVDIVDSVALMKTILYRLRAHDVGFEMVFVDNFPYFVDSYIAMNSDVDDEGIVGDAAFIDEILAGQERYPRRPLEKLGGREYVLDLVEKYDSYRELVAYLDAHVPDNASDYTFAENVAQDLVYYARDSQPNMDAFSMSLEDFGLQPTVAQLNHLLTLWTNLANDVPKWANNGWSPAEARSMAKENA